MSEQEDLGRFVRLMQQCQNDTATWLPQAAARLTHWQSYEGDLPGLVRFVRERLQTRPINGYRLHLRGGLSLESTVVQHLPHLFTAEDREVAQATLDGKVVE